MAYSANPAVKKCQGRCGQRKPAADYVNPGPEDRVCRTCREAARPAAIPAPVPLGDGRTAITLIGKHAHGRVALVSDAKVPLVVDYRWRVQEYVNSAGVKMGPYAVSKAPGGRMVYMHTLVSGFRRVDHEDGDGLNNTDPNLRDATQSQNLANTGSRGGTSRFKGVRRLPSGSWRAQIKVNYRTRYLGSYATEEQAARVVDAASLEVWGEFARLNFPV